MFLKTIGNDINLTPNSIIFCLLLIKFTKKERMWTCPKCKREFKNRNQDHSCGDFSINKVFEKYPEIFPLFNKLKNKVLEFGEIKIYPVKNAVMFAVHSTFLAVKPHKNYIALEFTSKKNYTEFPIEKSVRISKSRFAHFLKIDSRKNIDIQLINWLKEAYQSDIETI